jgi:hypothetical protein
MPFTFPTSPSPNQVYTSGSVSWKWNGQAWDAYNEYNLIRRFATSASYLYCGTAPSTTTGVVTTESDTVWTIVRLETNLSGSIASTTTAQPAGGVDWTNFLTHTYS